jgi:hypothetical protein
MSNKKFASRNTSLTNFSEGVNWLYSIQAESPSYKEFFPKMKSHNGNPYGGSGFGPTEPPVIPVHFKKKGGVNFVSLK